MLVVDGMDLPREFCVADITINRKETIMKEMKDLDISDLLALDPAYRGPEHEELARRIWGPTYGLGSFYDINGEGAQENATLVTTFEIELLVKHWAEERREALSFTQIYQQTGSRELRAQPYSSHRIAYFKTVLGAERLDAIVEKVFEGLWEEIEKGREGFEARHRELYPEDFSTEGTEEVTDKAAAAETEEAVPPLQ